jgi:hypothetical protein
MNKTIKNADTFLVYFIENNTVQQGIAHNDSIFTFNPTKGIISFKKTTEYVIEYTITDESCLKRLQNSIQQNIPFKDSTEFINFVVGSNNTQEIVQSMSEEWEIFQ